MSSWWDEQLKERREFRTTLKAPEGRYIVKSGESKLGDLVFIPKKAEWEELDPNYVGKDFATFWGLARSKTQTYIYYVPTLKEIYVGTVEANDLGSALGSVKEKYKTDLIWLKKASDGPIVIDKELLKDLTQIY